VVLRSLSLLADNCSDFSRLSAVSVELHSYYRAQEFSESLEAKSTQVSEPAMQPLQNSEASSLSICSDDAGKGIKLISMEDPSSQSTWLRIINLSICFQERVLVSQLQLEAPTLGGLLITGLSGSGKTTLLRAIAGLWQKGGSGVIHRPMQDGVVMFLPQQPYMSLGSLRDQLTYPQREAKDVDDETLCAILSRVQLPNLRSDLDAVCRWDERLSMGEQQRIAVARMLTQKPTYAILDEATSANDPANELLMYHAVQDTCKAFVSVGHRPSLTQFHSQRLHLLGNNGKWQLSHLCTNGNGIVQG